MSGSVNVMAPALLADAARSDLSTGKRKRSPDADDQGVERANNEHAQRVAKPPELGTFLVDVVEILKTYDTDPSILGHRLPAQAEGIPSAKRTKISPSSGLPQTIHEKLVARAYTNINEFSRDVSTAIEAIGGDENDAVHDRLTKFQSAYYGLLSRARAQDAHGLFDSQADRATNGDNGSMIKVESGDNTLQPSKSALSFAGPGGRPYFSSLQLGTPTPTTGPEEDGDSGLLESVLPKGMWTATVVPVRGRDGQMSPEPVPTLGQLLPRPSHLAIRRPPLDSPMATTRGNSPGWYKPGRFPSSRAWSSGRETYSNQKLRAGAWLSSAKTPSLPASLDIGQAKPQHRNVGVSESQREQTKEERRRLRKAEREFERCRDLAMFKGVFSSFAPSYDNSGSVVPQEQRSRLWWSQKAASGKASSNFDTEEPAIDGPQANQHDNIDDALDPQLLEEAVQSFQCEEQDEAAQDDGAVNRTASSVATNEDTEDILRDISEMLDTLSQHQRSRHSVPFQPKQALAEEFGTPSKPSAAEFDLHTMLRDQLVFLISALPPFAVARLDGDQLKDLNISAVLELEDNVHKGSLDDPTRPTPYRGGAAPNTIQHPSTSARQSTYGAAAPSPAARNAYSAPRPPSSFYPGKAPQPAAAGYGTYQQHVAQLSQRAANQPYGQSPMPPQGSSRLNPMPNGYLSHGNNATPVRVSPYQMANAQAAPQRPPQASPYGGTYGVPQGRSASPQHAQQIHLSQSPRASYPSSSQVGPTQHGYPQYRPTASSPQRTAALSNGVGTVGAQVQMTPEERAMIASRQQQAPQQSQHGRPISQPSPQPTAQTHPASSPVRNPSAYPRPDSSAGNEASRPISNGSSAAQTQ